MTRILRIPTAVLALAVLPGCSSGSKEAAPMTDQIQVTQFIASFNGAKENPKYAPEWFAQGAVPPTAELRKLAKYTCKVDGKPTISGDTATVKIKLLDAKEQEVGQVEWTLVREGGNWKLKSAPLP